MGNSQKVFVGQQFSDWTVVEKCARKYFWLCRCACGNTKPIYEYGLLLGQSKRCRFCASKRPREGMRKRPYESLFNAFCSHAKENGKSNVLTYEDFLQFTTESRCHYCWSSISWSLYGKGLWRSNLDRKDNARGYETENVVVCCRDCNWAKGNRYDYETWFEMTAVLRRRHG